MQVRAQQQRAAISSGWGPDLVDMLSYAGQVPCGTLQRVMKIFKRFLMAVPFAVSLALILAAGARAQMVEIGTAETEETNVVTVRSVDAEGIEREAVPVVMRSTGEGDIEVSPLQVAADGGYEVARDRDGYRVRWYWGVNGGFSPLIGSVRFGLLFPVEGVNRCGYGICHTTGVTTDVEVGVGGAKVGVGFGTLVHTGAVPVFGIRGGASVMMTWLDTEDDITLNEHFGTPAGDVLAGAEISMTAAALNLTVGAYGRIAGSDGGDDFVLNLSVGFGF